MTARKVLLAISAIQVIFLGTVLGGRRPAGAEPPWGRPVKGIVLAIEPVSETIDPGTPVRLRVMVQNQSKQPVKMLAPLGLLVGNFFLEVTCTSDDGERTLFARGHAWGIGPNPRAVVAIQPGERKQVAAELGLLLSNWRVFRPKKPGTLTFQARLIIPRLREWEDWYADGWTSSVASQPATVRVRGVPAAAKKAISGTLAFDGRTYRLYEGVTGLPRGLRLAYIDDPARGVRREYLLRIIDGQIEEAVEVTADDYYLADLTGDGKDELLAGSVKSAPTLAKAVRCITPRREAGGGGKVKLGTVGWGRREDIRVYRLAGPWRHPIYSFMTRRNTSIGRLAPLRGDAGVPISDDGQVDTTRRGFLADPLGSGAPVYCLVLSRKTTWRLTDGTRRIERDLLFEFCWRFSAETNALELVEVDIPMSVGDRDVAPADLAGLLKGRERLGLRTDDTVEQTRHGVNALMTHLESFCLDVSYWGDGGRRTLLLQTMGTSRPLPEGWSRIRIDRQQAKKIIDVLARGGFFNHCRNWWLAGEPKYAGPRYVLSVRSNELFGHRSDEDLGWGLDTLKRLDGLRAVLDGDAGKALDDLLRPLEAHRKEWTTVGAKE